MTTDCFGHLYSQNALKTKPSAIRDICSLVNRPDMRSLAGGWPDPAVFPQDEMIEVATELLRHHGPKVLQYGSSEGLDELRRELARQARDEGNTDCQPDEILITHGSAQGMDLITRVFMDPGDIVMAGLPTYVGATGTILAHGGDVVGVPVDEDGLNTELLGRRLRQLSDDRRRIKGVYVIPNFQNPTGVTLSLERRKDLVAFAEEFDFMIFEDDAYGDLRFEGKKLPSIKALDQSGRVVQLRSLSKNLVPGLRVAWLSAEAGVVRRLTLIKQFVDACTNVLGQHIVYEFIRRGWVRKRLGTLIAHYHGKRDFMLDQLKRHFPEEVRWNRPQGGFFVWVRLPEQIDAGDLLTEAIDRKVVFVAGSAFFVDGSGQNTLRLSYSQASKTEIKGAVAELGRLIKGRLNHVSEAQKTLLGI
jgi:2-aminoadipate transaminase